MGFQNNLSIIFYDILFIYLLLLLLLKTAKSLSQSWYNNKHE
jgi:hypothetical protein